MTDINAGGIGSVDYLVVGYPVEKASFSARDRVPAQGADRQQHDSGARPSDADKGQSRARSRHPSRAMPTTASLASRAVERDLAVLFAEQDVEEIGNSWSPAAQPRCWSGRTPGLRRSPLRCAGQEASWWAMAGSRPPGARRASRSGSPGGSEGSMRCHCSETDAIDPARSARAANSAVTAARTGATGEITAARAVPAPGAAAISCR